MQMKFGDIPLLPLLDLSHCLRQFDTRYACHLSSYNDDNDDDVSFVSPSQLLAARLGGIRRDQFGRGSFSVQEFNPRTASKLADAWTFQT